MTDKKEKPKVKAGNLTLKYRSQLESELKRLKKFYKDNAGLSIDQKKFLERQSEANWKKSGDNKTFKVINYGSWAGPKGWQQKGQTLKGRIELIEQEIDRTGKWMGKKYVKFGDHIPVPKGEKPPNVRGEGFTGFKSSFTGLYLGDPIDKRPINPFHHRSYDIDFQKTKEQLQIKKINNTITSDEDKRLQELDKVNENKEDKGNTVSTNERQRKLAIKDGAPTELAWANPLLPKGANYKDPNNKSLGIQSARNSVMNSKARLLISRAKDINRAYGVLNEDTKRGYLNNSITQQELEA